MVNYKEKSYQETYENFWKRIVENQDGTLNKDQVMRELSDYSMVMEHCALAYSTMTNGMISKQNTCYKEVENLFFELYWDKEVVRDDLKNIIEDAEDLIELKETLFDYLEIGEGEE